MTIADKASIAHLNTAQTDAVTAPIGKLLVLAGAGSGKTRVLVHRIAWLLEQHAVSPYAILAVTFTNKAAGEMRGRIEALLGRTIGGMWVGTFHGLAHRLLRTHWQDANLPEHFQILDSDDQYRMIRRLIKELGLDEKTCAPRQVQWYINQKKDEGLRASQIQDNGDLTERTLLKVYAAYEAACTRAGLVDFAELLLRSHELWLSHPAILQHYQQRFQHILVDEFQDTNTIQYAWITMLTTPVTNLMVVGDDDQSIYGWRGAKIENIHQFEQDFKDTQMVRLEQNYRSTHVILQAANALIEHNGARLGKNLWTQSQEGENIALYCAYNEQDEAHYIMTCIRQCFDQGMCLRDIAVLYRSNAQSRVLEEALLQARLPYRIYGGMRFFERAEIKHALAYLRLAVNRQDDAAFERIVNFPTRGIGDRSLLALRDVAKSQSISLWQAAGVMVCDQLLTARARNALVKFMQLIDNISAGLSDLTLAEQVEHMLSVSTLMQHYRQDKTDASRARIENMEELISAARQFQTDETTQDNPLTAFLATAALEAGEQQSEAGEDCVQLMTLHSAKGLEFSVVFLAGLEEGLFPHFMSATDPNRLEEERRLCYVGMTRAKQKLHLSYAESRRLRGSETLQRPSRFIQEIPADCMNEVRPRAQITRPVSHAYRGRSLYQKTPIYQNNSAIKAQNSHLRVGQQINHKKFGAGTVLDFEGSGAHLRVQVRFDSGDSKWLLASFVS